MELMKMRCQVCKKTFLTDAEPCCDDIVCQAIFWRDYEAKNTLTEVEILLEKAWNNLELDEIGL